MIFFPLYVDSFFYVVSNEMKFSAIVLLLKEQITAISLSLALSVSFSSAPFYVLTGYMKYQ